MYAVPPYRRGEPTPSRHHIILREWIASFCFPFASRQHITTQHHTTQYNITQHNTSRHLKIITKTICFYVFFVKITFSSPKTYQGLKNYPQGSQNESKRPPKASKNEPQMGPAVEPKRVPPRAGKALKSLYVFIVFSPLRPPQRVAKMEP